MRTRAFTLIELLVVIAIIALVIAIVLPALGGARNAAKNTATTALVNDLVTAVAQYEQDEQRLPGFYGVREMGDAANTGEGFTTMENIMLDLAGGYAAAASGTTIAVGALPAGRVDIDVSLIGSSASFDGQDAYFNPPEKFYTAGNGQQGLPDHDRLPDLVDAFGNPVLAWARDPLAAGDFVIRGPMPGTGAVRARQQRAAGCVLLGAERRVPQRHRRRQGRRGPERGQPARRRQHAAESRANAGRAARAPLIPQRSERAPRSRCRATSPRGRRVGGWSSTPRAPTGSSSRGRTSGPARSLIRRGPWRPTGPCSTPTRCRGITRARPTISSMASTTPCPAPGTDRGAGRDPAPGRRFDGQRIKPRWS